MGGKTVEETFEGTPARVFAAMTAAAAELGFTILSSQPEAGVLSFNTGRSMKSWTGQDLSATAVPVTEVSTKVIVGGSLAVRGSGPQQLGSWGEKGKLSKKFLKRVGDTLPQTAEPAARIPVNPASVADELRKLAELRDAGVLSAEEFEQQKARLLAP